MRHSFQVMEELGAECDRLGVRVVNVHGATGYASDFLATVARYIEAREKELHGRRWIPVTERLPEEGQRVLAYEKPELIVVAEMHSRSVSGGHWWSTDDGHTAYSVFPTHWMPLPAPPTDGK